MVASKHTLEGDHRDSHVQGLAGRRRSGIGEGVQGDVHLRVGAQVVAVSRRQGEEVHAGRVDACCGKLRQDVCPCAARQDMFSQRNCLQSRPVYVS